GVIAAQGDFKRAFELLQQAYEIDKSQNILRQQILFAFFIQDYTGAEILVDYAIKEAEANNWDSKRFLGELEFLRGVARDGKESSANSVLEV
ncbi:MAG: hypothetical protein EBS77_11140, partial [Gammaproteobacteria bacterium]|nr:hypothetical protein [Gammaproteobacteria bacterium]